MTWPNMNMEPHPDDVKRDDAALKGEPDTDGALDTDTTDAPGPLPGDEDEAED